MSNNETQRFDGDKILQEVNSMRDDIIKKRINKDLNYFSKKYQYLYDNVPTMFRMVYDNDFDYMPMINLMLEKYKKMSNGSVTHEDASKDIGETLAEKYIYPNIDMSK